MLILFPLPAWKVGQFVRFCFSLSSLALTTWKWADNGRGRLMDHRKFLMHDPSAQAWPASCHLSSSLFGSCVRHQFYAAWSHTTEVISQINNTSTKGPLHNRSRLTICCYYEGDSGIRGDKKHYKCGVTVCKAVKQHPEPQRSFLLVHNYSTIEASISECS